MRVLRRRLEGDYLQKKVFSKEKILQKKSISKRKSIAKKAFSTYKSMKFVQISRVPFMMLPTFRLMIFVSIAKRVLEKIH